MPNILKAVRKQPITSSKKNNAVPGDDALRHLAFDNSLQPNIITIASTGKIIMANQAACKLFGYSIEELLTRSRSVIFAIEEKSFRAMLKQRTAKSKSAAIVTAIKKNGSQFTCEITSAVFKDAGGIKNAITTIVDISKRLLEQQKIDSNNETTVTSNTIAAKVKSDKELADNNEWIKYIAKTSYDVMWDWDIASGNIYVGDSVKEVFGHDVKNNTIHINDFERCLLPADKNKLNKKLRKSLASASKSWRDAVVIKRLNGSLAATVIRASIIRDDQQRATRLIGAMQDVSRLQVQDEQLSQLENQAEKITMFKLAGGLSCEGIWDWDIINNRFFLGEGFETLFGYQFNDIHDAAYDWNNFLHPDDKPAVEKALKIALVSKALNWEFPFRFIRADGSIAFVLNRASIIRDDKGKALRMIGVVHDLSIHHEMETRLAEEIELKEKQVEEAIADAKDAERSYISKELHDNVNQLLGASGMFLEMAKRGGANSKLYLDRSSEYTLMAIEDIRKLTRGISNELLNNLGLGAAIEKMAADMEKGSKLSINVHIEKAAEKNLNEKFKLNIFRIIQELMKNVLSHAEAKKARISLTKQDHTLILEIKDDGIGFDLAAEKTGIGISNVKSRVASFNGTFKYTTQPGKGCSFSVSFPVTNLSYSDLLKQ